MRAVTNAGPLIALGKLGFVFLLSKLYDQVLVPSAVYNEVVVRGMESGSPDAYIVERSVTRGELILQDVSQATFPEKLQASPLGDGEKQTIYLALVEAVEWVLIDDLLARKTAQEFGLKVKGTLGILVEAYRQQVITLEELEYTFRTIVEREDIWIAEPLVRRIWKAVLHKG